MTDGPVQSVTVPTALLFALVLLLAAASGAAVLARIFRDDPADPASRADAVLSFALPVGLVLAAAPGWMLNPIIYYVPIRGLALPLASRRPLLRRLPVLPVDPLDVR